MTNKSLSEIEKQEVFIKTALEILRAKKEYNLGVALINAVNKIRDLENKKAVKELKEVLSDVLPLYEEEIDKILEEKLSK